MLSRDVFVKLRVVTIRELYFEKFSSQVSYAFRQEMTNVTHLIKLKKIFMYKCSEFKLESVL